MKLLIPLTFMLFFFSVVNAQEEAGRCFFKNAQEECYKTNPKAKAEMIAFEKKVIKQKALFKKNEQYKLTLELAMPINI